MGGNYQMGGLKNKKKDHGGVALCSTRDGFGTWRGLCLLEVGG